jgi:hypothetical protein
MGEKTRDRQLHREGAKSAKGGGVCGRDRARWLVAALIAVLIGAVPCHANDPAGDLDQGTLVDALAQEGMGELLLHLVETEQPDDPVLARQIQIAGLRIEYQRLLAESGPMAKRDAKQAEVLRGQAREAFTRLTDAMREVIREYRDHDQRPIWQTDLAQNLILDYLHGLNQSAPLFADFGVTTAEQQQALADAAPEALALLVDAQLRLFNLRGEVGRDPAHSQQLQSSGLFFRLFDEYDQRRTPYFLAYAAYLVACLPAEAPYYADPQSPDAARVPQRVQDPGRERARLLSLAEGELKKVSGKVTDGLGIRDAAASLQARVLLARGRYDQALQAVEEILDGGQRGMTWLTARLTRAATLDRMGRVDQALQELNGLRRDRAVTGDLRYSLLVTDLTHRVLLNEAHRQPPTRRDAAISQSYQPYIELLSGPITGAQSQGLRDFIYRRWEASLGEDAGSMDVLPAMVRQAISQVLRQQGQAIMARLESPGDGQDLLSADRQRLREQAQRKYAEAIRLAQTLTGDEVGPAIRSEAMYNLALTMHAASPKDPGNRLKLTAILTDLADEMPGQPVAEDAISAAVALLRELHQVLPTPVGVDKAYGRAAGVLFTKFPVSEAADGERLYYGYAVLAQSGKHREAVDVYSRVPFDHEDYFRAQRQALLSLLAHERTADPTAKPRIRRELVSLMKRIGTDSQRIRDSLINPDRAATARRAEATVRLTKAELAMDDLDYDAVTEALDGFETAYPDQADLIAEALERRIIALGDAGQHEALADAAQRMVRDYPDQAAPVIDLVLAQAERRIEQLQVKAATANSIQRKALLTQADDQARAASLLSGYLLDWANTQGFDAQTLMPFEVIRAKTLRLSGGIDEAYPILRRLVVDFPNDAQVMIEYAQVLYERGDDESLIEAVRYYDRLITGLGAPYPPAWWTAWMRRLQINDRLNEGTEEIPLRVRQLRMTDPDLGGPITKMELERLEQKHGR